MLRCGKPSNVHHSTVHRKRKKMNNTTYIGKPADRPDGRKKVQGRATYAGEFAQENMVYGYVVQSEIAEGEIINIDIARAEQVPGVLRVFTHENIPESVKINSDYSDPLAPPGQPFRPLYNEKILYNGQPIALVVAEDFETARFAAGFVKTEYRAEECSVDIRENQEKATHEDVDDSPENRGDADKAFAAADYTVEAEYYQPRHYHNPMEPHATIAIWDKENESFKIYDKIQGVRGSQAYIRGVFSMEKEKVQVLSPYVGGGFGSGLRPQYQLFMAALAAKVLERPAKVTLTRRQMFSFGHRPANLQKVKLGADKNGKLLSIEHNSVGETSKFEKYSESVVGFTGVIYACENVKTDYRLVPVSVYTPNDARAPGGATGMFAVESAVDELAHKIGIDPLELRLKNYAERDNNEDKPFSSKELRACYAQAAKAIGWKENYNPQPRSRREGNHLVGYGMATGIWEAMQQKASARAVLHADGTLKVYSGTADNGAGTYAIMTQIAAETVGVSMDKTEFILGDTSLPKAPIQGGSWTAASVGSAVKTVSKVLRHKIYDLAHKTYPDRMTGTITEEAVFADGGFTTDNDTTIKFTDLLRDAGESQIEVTTNTEPGKERENYSCYAHSCVMVKVLVDADLGMIAVPKIVTAVAGGKILNPKTARSQIIGGNVWGISAALEEEGMIDPRNGRIMNANLAEYHVAVHADIQEQEVIFVEEEDDIVNPLGAKGLGEIGIVGVAAAIANAVFNATGKRVRELPITLDKVL